ncbi:MAG: NACHT domain-containing protein [Synechococcales bacterium]|nr:NACHT domain-containing protein [Synechococcales bacterium]
MANLQGAIAGLGGHLGNWLPTANGLYALIGQLRLPWLDAIHQWLKSPEVGAIVGLFVAFSSAITFLSSQTEALQKLLEGIQKLVGLLRPPTKPQTIINTQENRKKLLRVLKSELARRQRDSLHNLVMIDMMVQEQPQQVDRAQLLPLAPEPESKLERVLQVGNQPGVAIGSNRSIFEIYNQIDIDGKLLILGNPGSGKTTELLKFAAALLERAEQEAGQPIPVILELSAWKDDRLSIHDWIVRQLRKVYNVPTAVSQQWLQDEQLIVLLDGLNELGLVRQARCTQAINEFLVSTAYPHCVVCCREEEYKAAGMKLTALNGAIYLKPLTDAQIQQYLKQVKRITLWDSLAREPALRELARSPLLLTMMVAVYEGREIKTIQELFDVYIEQRFQQAKLNQSYPPGKVPSRQKTRHYLSWLALQLKMQSKPELLIERLQPSWLGDRQQRVRYRMLCGLMIGVLCLVGVGLVMNQLSFSLPEIQLGLAIAFLFGFCYGVYNREDLNHRLAKIPGFRLVADILDNEEIEPVKLGWSMAKAKTGLITGLTIGLHLGVVLAIYFVFRQMWSEAISWSLSFAGSYGCLIGFVSGLRADIKTSNHPNQGMKESLRNAIMMLSIGTGLGTVLAAIALFLATRQIDWNAAVWLGIGCGLFSSLFSGGLPCIQHLVLRLLLWRSGVMPWNYAQFLRYAHDLRFLQQIGGRYRFIHELLREHFAGLR